MGWIHSVEAVTRMGGGRQEGKRIAKAVESMYPIFCGMYYDLYLYLTVKHKEPWTRFQSPVVADIDRE